MASPISILKNVLNINKNKIHVINIEERTVTIHSNGTTFEQDQIFAHIRPYERMMCRCPECNQVCPKYDTKQTTESHWRAPSLNGIPVFLCYRPHRIKCPKHGVVTELIPWSDGKSRFTPDFNNEIAWTATQCSKTAIAEFFGINWRTVGNCIKAARDRIEPDVKIRLRGLIRICVDETAYHKGHSYITVVYDMDKNQVVWIHIGHGYSVFKLFCEELTPEEREKIQVVAGDGAKWIDQCTEDYFPNAIRCVDPFHVTGWASEAIDKVRTAGANKASREYEKVSKQLKEYEDKIKETRKNAEEELGRMPKKGRPSKRKLELLALLAKLDEEEHQNAEQPKKKGRPKKIVFSPEHQKILDDLAEKAKLLKGCKYAILHNPEKRTEGQNEMIELIEASYPDIYRGFQLKEILRLILHMKPENYKLAEANLEKWITEAAESGLKPFKELSEKIERHKQNILNSIRYKANSAKSEAVNTSIKVLIRMARGFRSVDNMMALIYLKCSDLVIPLRNRPQPSPENKRVKREEANERRKAKQNSMHQEYPGYTF